MSRRSTSLAAAVYVVLAAWFLETKLRHAPTTPTAAAAGDLISYYYPTLAYGFGALRRGELVLWNPHQACGVSFVEATALHQGFFYPIYGLFLLFGAEAGFDLQVIAHLAIAALGAYALCRHFGLDPVPSGIGGVVYAYQGSTIGVVYYPDFLAATAWIPWTLLFVDRVVVTGSLRSSAVLAGILGAALLGGHGVQLVYFSLWAALPLVALRLFSARSIGRAAALLGLSLTLGVALALVRILPTAAHYLGSWRAGGIDVATAEAMSLAPPTFWRGLVSADPAAFRDSWLGDPLRHVYVGTVSLALACAGAVLWRARSVSVPIALAGIGAVLYSFGPRSALYRVLSALPAGTWFRGADRALVVFGLAVAVLSGAALHVVARSGRRIPLVLAVVGALAGVAVLGVLLGGPRTWRVQALYASGAAALVATALWSGPRFRDLALLAIGALVVFDLFHAQRPGGTPPSRLGDWFSRLEPHFAEIRRRQEFDRTYIWASFDPRAPLYFFSDVARAGTIHGIWQTTDYDPLCERRFVDYLDQLGPPPPMPVGSVCYQHLAISDENIRLLELMGARFFLVPEEEAAKLIPRSPELAARWTPILRQGGVALYEYASPLPRAFVAERVEVEPDPRRLLARMKTTDLRRIAYVEEAGADASGGSGQAAIVEYAPNHVAVSVNVTARAMLVLTDRYDPGWKASVDGVPAKLFRADYIFRGVLLPPGSHRVQFVYRPWTFFVGAASSALALLAVVGLVAYGRGRSADPP